MYKTKTKAQPMKEKLVKFAFIKINFCFVKYMLKRMTKQDIGWKKKFAKHVSDKEFVSKM